MAVAVGDIVRITAKLLLLGVSDVVNVFHFSVATNDTLNDTAFMQSVASALDVLYSGINGIYPPAVTYSSVEGQNITQDELLPSRAWPTLVAGVGGGEWMPETVAACVFHRTLKPRVRAAKFLGPCVEGTNDDGELIPSTVAVLQTFGDALTTGLTATDIALTYVAFNRLLSTATVVSQALVPARWRTQRRRRLGVGS